MLNQVEACIILLGLGLLMVYCSKMDDGHLTLAEKDISFCSLDTSKCISSSDNSTLDGRPRRTSSSNCTESECVCPANRICVRKCCPWKQVLGGYGTNNGTTKCVPVKESDGEAGSGGGGWSPHQHFWHYVAHSEFKGWTNLSKFENVHVIYGRPPCNSSYQINPRENEEDAYLLVENGSLINQNVSESRYCVDYVENEQTVLPYLCDDDDDDDDNHGVDDDRGQSASPSRMEKTFVEKVERYLKIYGLLFSVVFMLLTFFVYAVVPSLQNLQGKNLLCHVFSLIIGYLGLIAVSGTVRLPSINFCIISAFVVQFSFLASFFWLNIMCFDLWCTFSGYRSFNGSPKERDLKKFLAYCLYAWGCPTLIVAATIFVEFYPYLPKNFIRPQFGKTKCFFETDGAIFIYFYSFISVIVFSNLCMFISTTFILKKHKKETKVFKRSGSRRHLEHDKQRFNLYLKLFIVMGVNWMMEVISFYVPAPAGVWLITDIGNTLQGVLIFLIFVCKRRIFLLLNKRLFPHHPFINRPKKNVSTVTSVISLASVRSGVVSPTPQVQTTDKLEIC